MKFFITYFFITVAIGCIRNNSYAQNTPSADTNQLHLYYANDTHTDVMWNSDEAGYKKMILEMTDYYLNMNEMREGE